MSDDIDFTPAFGWRPQLPDIRDHKLNLASPSAISVLPRYVNLSKSLPGVWNQGNLGSCTAHAGAAAWCYDRKLQGLPFIMPSRLFIYYNERALEGTVLLDSGAYLRDCIKTLVKTGACDEALWPYDIGNFRSRPSAACYTDAVKHKGVEYLQVSKSIDQLKACLAEGFPFIFGFSVYESFKSQQVARTGMVSLPGFWDTFGAGHAVCALGYNRHNYFLVRNSWGSRWGDQDFPGYCWMPPEYIGNPNLASDFWTLRTVSG
jgi:C1A family cysteine protease